MVGEFCIKFQPTIQHTNHVWGQFSQGAQLLNQFAVSYGGKETSLYPLAIFSYKTQQQ